MQEDIKKAIDIMRKGGIIAYPTDTIWGIGCDATNESAVAKIYKLKQRLETKSMIVLLGDSCELERYVDVVPEIAYQLIEVTDKPLTIIYDNGINLAPNLINADKSIGIRVTSEAFSKELCNRFHKPIVSTSANISGKPSPQNFSEIDKEILDGVDYVVRYRQDDNTQAQPSSIIKISESGEFKIIRK